MDLTINKNLTVHAPDDENPVLNTAFEESNSQTVLDEDTFLADYESRFETIKETEQVAPGIMPAQPTPIDLNAIFELNKDACETIIDFVDVGNAFLFNIVVKGFGHDKYLLDPAEKRKLVYLATQLLPKDRIIMSPIYLLILEGLRTFAKPWLNIGTEREINNQKRLIARKDIEIEELKRANKLMALEKQRDKMQPVGAGLVPDPQAQKENPQTKPDTPTMKIENS